MSIIAKLNYLRIAPRKVRLVADLIRGKKALEAQTILNFTLNRPARPLLKLLKSAVANAKQNFNLLEENLYISKITVDEGPKFKRWMPRARGSASEIHKKTSHITLVLNTISPQKGETKPKEIKKKEIKAGVGEKEEVKTDKVKFKPELKTKKPKIEKVIPRIFRRKAF